jgi:quinol monooxygenase YgiN
VILIVVRHLIRPKYADEFPRMVFEFTAATRAEPGTISFEWSRSTDDPAVYFLIEERLSGPVGQ